MSRAFVNEDGAGEPLGQYSLPQAEDPGFAMAAARALLRGADVGDTPGAEAATGYYFGDPALRPQVELPGRADPGGGAGGRARAAGAARRAVSPPGGRARGALTAPASRCLHGDGSVD
jgi:hypothetical protein